MDINIIHHNKSHPKTHNPSFEVYMQNSNSMMVIIFSQMHSICSSFSNFVGLKKN
jgi:hypothetical protein